jgi:Zn-dependent protease
MKYAFSLLTAILLFVSVLVHELAHSYFSLLFGGSIKEIRLHLLGGVASMNREVKEPLKVMVIVAAGPLSSIILGVLLLVLNYILNPASFTEGNTTLWIRQYFHGAFQPDSCIPNGWRKNTKGFSFIVYGLC